MAFVRFARALSSYLHLRQGRTHSGPHHFMTEQDGQSLYLSSTGNWKTGEFEFKLTSCSHPLSGASECSDAFCWFCAQGTGHQVWHQG